MKIKQSMDRAWLRPRADIPYLYTAPDSPMKCDKCQAHLGLWHMVRFALFKKRGALYNVPCKRCTHLNARKKGEIGKSLDERWEGID